MLPERFVFFQRMSADVNAKHLFFKSQKLLLVIFSDLRQLNLILALILLAHQIEQCHLPCHTALLFMCDAVHNVCIDHHKLLSCPTQAVKSSGFDEILYRPLIRFFPGQTLNKILQAAV